MREFPLRALIISVLFGTLAGESASGTAQTDQIIADERDALGIDCMMCISPKGYERLFTESELIEGQDGTNQNPSAPVAAIRSSKPRPPDFNQEIYHKNKLEFSLESGWLPINIPFVYDFLLGDTYTRYPISYTLAPNIVSLRWHIDHIDGPSLLRGDCDLSFSGAYTAIPRGPETRYFAFDFGIRRNFVPRRWRVAPYFEMRGGIGNINAKGPYGVLYAQGQDMTFTYMMGAGARYNFSPRFSVAAGLTYMHISNFNLSLPKVANYGINVYGPIIGIYMRLGKTKPSSLAK